MVKVENLNISFTYPHHTIQLVEDLSFSIENGKSLALVGASGSGKSLTSLAIMGLLPKNALVSGKISIENQIIENFESVRGNLIAMVFQEPMSALNPIMKVGDQVVEAILQYQNVDKSDAKLKTLEWFRKVKLPDVEKIFEKYPHELSGGQKQRIVIAMAMVNNPKLLIADEPTTALDVTVQQEIIQLMLEIQVQFNISILFITHDLAVARLLTNDFLILEQGKEVKSFTFPEAIVKNVDKIEGDNILSFKDVTFAYSSNNFFKKNSVSEKLALDAVTFDLKKGETLALCGESGCGKSTISKAILGLIKPRSGIIEFKNQNILDFSTKLWKTFRKSVQIVYQDPYAALNPRMKIGEVLMEPILFHKIDTYENAFQKVLSMLDAVGLPHSSFEKYPHEFSGGQRQRICIARALMLNPELIICDESIAALDVKMQFQILTLLNQLKKDFGLTYLFITHDLNVVKNFSDRTIIMQSGRIEEIGPTDLIFSQTTSAYTKKLIAAIPL